MDLVVVFSFAVAALVGVVAVVSAVREGRSLSTLFFVVGMFLLGAQRLFTGWESLTSEPLEKAGWENWRLAVYALLPFCWLGFSLSYGRGNARDFLRRWRTALAAALVLPLFVAVVFHGQLVKSLFRAFSTQNWNYSVTFASFILNLVWLLASVFVLMNLERTLRAAVGIMRWRVKFMIIGLGAFFCMDAYISSQVVLSRSIDPSLQAVDSGALAIGCILGIRSIWRRGAEATVYPPVVVFQNSATLFVGGIYLVVIGILAKLAVWVGARASFPMKAFAILLLVLAASVLLTSDRAKLWVRQRFSEYFQKPMYDYRLVWRKFSEQIAQRNDPVALSNAVVKLVSETFSALSTSIWLTDESRESLTLAASTLLSKHSVGENMLTGSEARQVITALEKQSGVVNIDVSNESWAEPLRQCHPMEFRTGGDRVCVPLVAGGNLLGVMILGDRVSGLRFTLQDFDLLHCVGDQTASSLLNVRLSKKLLQNKEMEAFQTMSTFFVHDLKNLASTLNLMLKNLPIHFENPDFRADAIRGIAKTCDHINHLISRLTLLRQNLQLHSAEVDLNAVIVRALDQCPPPEGVEITQHLPQMPKMILDAEQMDKVITNLTLNAVEAVPPGGRIAVETSHQNGWAIITVTDSGCGMDTEFITRSLFRPFQTTKKKGLGIGMFQSKMIVEAHGGRIEVESQRGKGSTFRVLLPLPKSAV